jgi:hypothetical protein
VDSTFPSSDPLNETNPGIGERRENKEESTNPTQRPHSQLRHDGAPAPNFVRAASAQPALGLFYFEFFIPELLHLTYPVPVCYNFVTMNYPQEIPVTEEQQQEPKDDARMTTKEPPVIKPDVIDTFPAQPATQQQLQNAEQKIEERMSAFERSMIRLTSAGVIVGVITLLIFSGQLYEMIEGGKQTDKLVDYAKTQSQAAKEIDQAGKDFAKSAEGINLASQISTSALQKTATYGERSIDLANEHFRQEERPYLWISSMEAPQFVAGDKAKWNFHFANFGRSPAVGVLGRVQIVFGPGGDKKMHADLFSQIHIVNQKDGGFIPTGDQTNWTTAQSDEILTVEDVKYITDNDAGMVFFAHFEYFDSGGRKYDSEFCKFRLKTGAIGNCPLHDTVK